MAQKRGKRQAKDTVIQIEWKNPERNQQRKQNLDLQCMIEYHIKTPQLMC